MKFLFMDDERIILEMAGEIAEMFGHEAFLCESGEDLIKICSREKDSGVFFDAVFMDLNVRHGMGAREAMPKLLELNPDSIVVLSSGSIEEAITHNYRQYGFFALLPKPYEIEEMKNIFERIENEIQKRTR